MQRALDANHVENGNALGDRNDQFDLGINRLEDRVRCKWWWNINNRSSRAGSFLGFRNGVVVWQTNMGRATLARRNARNHLRAIGERLFGVERAGIAGHALGDHLGVLVD